MKKNVMAALKRKIHSMAGGWFQETEAFWIEERRKNYEKYGMEKQD
mgnify:CR=1 FL=1